MTRSQYVKDRLTKVDRLKGRSMYVPALWLLGFILWGLILNKGDFTFEQGRVVIIVFIITGIISAILHGQYQKKANLLIEEFDELRRLGKI